MPAPIVISRAWRFLGGANTQKARYISLLALTVVFLFYIVLSVASNVQAEDRKCTDAYGLGWDHQTVTIDDKGSTKAVCKNNKTHEEKRVP